MRGVRKEVLSIGAIPGSFLENSESANTVITQHSTYMLEINRRCAPPSEGIGHITYVVANAIPTAAQAGFGFVVPEKIL